MLRRVGVLAVATLVWLCATPGVVWAQPAPEAAHALVPPPARPTEVAVAMHLVALTRVSPPNEPFPTFQAELVLDARWNDPRLATEPPTVRRTYLGADVDRFERDHWWPDLELDNVQGQRQVEGRELIVSPDGSVTYLERFQATFTARVDLRRFPFDRQTLEVAVASLPWHEGDLRLRPLDARPEVRAQGSNEWRVVAVRGDVSSHREVQAERAFSRFVMRAEVERLPWFYLWKIAVPLLFVVMLGWSTFWMTGEAAPTRLQRAFIATLSVVAFHQVVSQNLPRIGYLTFLDGVVYLAFVSSGLSIVQIIATHHLGPERAGRLDRTCRWAFPLGFGLVLGGLWAFFHR